MDRVAQLWKNQEALSTPYKIVATAGIPRGWRCGGVGQSGADCAGPDCVLLVGFVPLPGTELLAMCVKGQIKDICSKSPGTQPPG